MQSQGVAPLNFCQSLNVCKVLIDPVYFIFIVCFSDQLASSSNGLQSLHLIEVMNRFGLL